MSVLLKEALVALALLEKHEARVGTRPIRIALEAALRGDEAWGEIRAWVARAPGFRACEIGMWVDGTHTCMLLVGLLVQKNHTGETYLEAITKAEAWCRAELAK